MTHTVFSSANSHIYQFPQSVKILPATVTELTVADTHANAIKKLYILIFNGLISLSQPDYEALVLLYDKLTERWLEDDIESFDALIESIVILRTDVLVRFLGDETGDRGVNDYFVLKLFEKLKTSGLPYRILVSNHGMEFVHYYEQKFTKNWILKDFAFRNLGEGENHLDNYASSLKNLNYFLEKGLVCYKRFMCLVETVYKPALCLLDVSLDFRDNHLFLFTHAPVGLEIVEKLAEKLDISCVYTDAVGLAKVIEEINQVFHRNYVCRNRVMELYNVYHTTSPIPATAERAVERLTWFRSKDESLSSLRKYPVTLDGSSVFFVHGHDLAVSTLAHVLNLHDQVGQLTPTDQAYEKSPKHPAYVDLVTTHVSYPVYQFLTFVKERMRALGKPWQEIEARVLSQRYSMTFHQVSAIKQEMEAWMEVDSAIVDEQFELLAQWRLFTEPYYHDVRVIQADLYEWLKYDAKLNHHVGVLFQVLHQFMLFYALEDVEFKTEPFLLVLQNTCTDIATQLTLSESHRHRLERYLNNMIQDLDKAMLKQLRACLMNRNVWTRREPPPALSSSLQSHPQV